MSIQSTGKGKKNYASPPKTSQSELGDAGLASSSLSDISFKQSEGRQQERRRRRNAPLGRNKLKHHGGHKLPEVKEIDDVINLSSLEMENAWILKFKVLP